MATRFLRASQIGNLSRSSHVFMYHRHGALLTSNRGFRQAKPFQTEYQDPFPPPSKKWIFIGAVFFTTVMLFGSGMVTPADFQQWEPIGRDKVHKR